MYFMMHAGSATRISLPRTSPSSKNSKMCRYETNRYCLNKNVNKVHFYLPVGRAVTRSSLEWEVRDSNLGPVKSYTVLPTARHRCDISLKGAVFPGRNDAEMGPANSLHARRNTASIIKDLKFNFLAKRRVTAPRNLVKVFVRK